MSDLSSISNQPGGGLIVAVDGPSGAGKSTVCRAVAAQLGAKYLDTGAMYRVATLHVLREGIDPTDTAAVIAATASIPLSVNDDPASREVLLGGEDVSKDIRSTEVNRAVSAVSAVPEVRENLVAKQRELSAQAHRCILDGRDIGTTVLPDAPVKVFLTASAEVRARRRFEQEQATGIDSDYETVLADVIRRDELDSNRAVSPLRPAEDAIILDTSELTLEQVIDTLITLIEKSAEGKN
ncbi:(d)CMP kinase [Corynebacterium sp. SCR221107]|uniref:(d)CMP kinase n=1 Tax=Corynebacterium sp. SCR221107 TaxID=3017361 RepID=UPI0022EC2AF8|nr:(d)CMP kinase [Corynebacterium sp. SCR221107]WBT07640.1 (d)CMP kinase [Corynebacterium sp. SCR221107]